MISCHSWEFLPSCVLLMVEEIKQLRAWIAKVLSKESVIFWGGVINFSYLGRGRSTAGKCTGPKLVWTILVKMTLFRTGL